MVLVTVGGRRHQAALKPVDRPLLTSVCLVVIHALSSLYHVLQHEIKSPAGYKSLSPRDR